MTDLNTALLREEGWQRQDSLGYISIFGVAVRNGNFIRVAARWDVFTKGVLGVDPDAEAMSIMVISEISSQALHRLSDDIFDLTKRARARMEGQPGCEAVVTAVDLGGHDAGGEGYLLGSQIRDGIPGVFALRTTSDADLPRPTYDAAHRAFRMSPEALTGALAARAGARQVLMSDDAKQDAKLLATEALRQAGAGDPRAAPPLVRILAWMSEIVHRPMVEPLLDRTGTGSIGHSPQSTGGVRITR